MKFYLWMRQSGDGCDYTIGCGQRLVKLEAETIEQARVAANGQFDYFSIGSEERRLDEAVILSFVEDAMPRVREIERERENAKSDAETKRKREQLAKLKQELGES
jgi:hypothetical protein